MRVCKLKQQEVHDQTKKLLQADQVLSAYHNITCNTTTVNVMPMHTDLGMKQPEVHGLAQKLLQADQVVHACHRYHVHYHCNLDRCGAHACGSGR